MEETQPRISVIVPCFNIAGYLPACLDSLAAQTCDSFEVICVDDGSTDNTGLILDERAEADSRFKVLHQKHSGTSTARNAGVAASVAPLISFVDGDDYVSSHYLEVLEGLIKQHDADISSCGFIREKALFANRLTDDSSAPTCALTDCDILDAKEAMQKSAQGAIYITFWGKLFTRKLIPPNPFPENMCYEDLWLFGHVMKAASKIVHTSRPLYCYVSRESSITRAKPAPLSRFFNFYNASNEYERLYAEICKLERATDDPRYCIRLLHHICGQDKVLHQSSCSKQQGKELEDALYEELSAAYHLALIRGVSPTQPQMLRTALKLHAPRIHDAAFNVYRFVKGI